MQPLSILFGAGFTVAVGYSCGALFLRKSSADPAMRFIAGSAILSALVFMACALRLVYPAFFLVLGAISIAAARSEFPSPHFKRIPRRWLLFVPFAVLYLANAMAPEISFDGSRYHLGLVSRFVAHHGFYPIRESFYAAFPEGIEMLYLFAFTFGRHSAAAVVHLAFLVALTVQVFTWVRREGGEVAGFAAAFLVFASPLMGVDGSSALIDVAVAAIAFTLFRVLELWDEQRSLRLLIAAGVLAGFAFSAKYTAFLAIPCAVGFVLWRSRRLGWALAIAGVAGVVVAPWLIKNWLWFANPLAPFFNRYFPNPYVSASFEAEYRASQGAFSGGLPMQLTVWGSLGGLFGPVFLLAPLALFRWRLLIPAVVFSAGFWWNPGARFLIPAVPFLASAMVLTEPRIWLALIGLHAVLSWPTVVRRYCHADAWRLDKVTYREALRIKPEEGFLESNLPQYGVARMLDRVTPPGAVIYTQVPIPEAYTTRKVLVGYQSTESIHEVRACLHGQEVSRRGWRGPAEVLDGRPVSLSMPEKWLEVAPPQSLRLDEVWIESQPNIHPVVELHDGSWGRVGSPEFEQVAPPDNLRRAAADELRRCGIDYLLVFDDEFGAEDLRARAVEWGVTEVAHSKGARLYKLP